MNKETIKKFISYLLVGGLATIVEWTLYRIFTRLCSMEYLIATLVAILFSTFSNWLFGRLITFRNAPKTNIGLEILKIYGASIVGLLLNMLFMWLLHGCLGIWDMLAKMISTGLVFMYNYLIRDKVIYREERKKDGDKIEEL